MKRVIATASLVLSVCVQIFCSGCGMVAGGFAFISSTCALFNRDLTNSQFSVVADCDTGPMWHDDLKYEKAELDSRKKIEFSDAWQTSANLSVRRYFDVENRGWYAGPVVSWVARQFDAEMEGVAASGRSDAACIGGEVGMQGRNRPVSFYVRYVAGRSEVHIPQLREKSELPHDAFDARFSRLTVGGDYAPARWCRVKAGVVWDTVALPADSHVNDSFPLFGIGGMENGFSSWSPYAGLLIQKGF